MKTPAAEGDLPDHARDTESMRHRGAFASSDTESMRHRGAFASSDTESGRR